MQDGKVYCAEQQRARKNQSSVKPTGTQAQMHNDNAGKRQRDKGAGHGLAIKLAAGAQPDTASQQHESQNKFSGPVQWHSVDSRGASGALSSLIAELILYATTILTEVEQLS